MECLPHPIKKAQPTARTLGDSTADNPPDAISGPITSNHPPKDFPEDRYIPTVIGGKFWHGHEINPAGKQQLLELLHHHKAPCLQTLRGYNIEYILPNLTLKTSRSTLGFDHCLNSLWHALN